MPNEIELDQIVQILKERYLNTVSALEDVSRSRDPYRVLISCVLSLRTKDEVTAAASKRLFARASTPEAMVQLTKAEIEALIYPVGFYHRKAEQIREISRTLIAEHDSNVPDTLDELLQLKGVGRKTANIVITMGFHKQGIAVDTHVHRISNRLGLVKTKTPEQTEFALRDILPEKHWIVFNNLLVMHGQRVCTPISPKCSICPISNYCDRVGVERFR
ncbi:MAG TPA: endonuclease III [Methanomicrobia archaeon]|nr:endonuclease III [Methanomicrobia archaeon]